MIPKANRIIAGGVFLTALALYLKTMAPTVSFWDCGEFIAASYILGVPHPPGSPLFILLGRLFTLLPFPADIAARVNLISVLASALAVMFLYLIIVRLVVMWRGRVVTTTDALIAYGSAAVGALTFMVTDSHWFNAVEAEVYATTTFLTALVVWLVLRWSQLEGQNQINPTSRKSNLFYLLLIAYILGLAAGIHLLNLLTLPFIALIIYFRRGQFTWQGFGLTVTITAGLFLVIYLGIIKGLPRLAEAAGVSAVVLVLALLMIGTVLVIYYRVNLASIALTCLLLITVGYSSYATIFIRSSQNPAIDENDPETTRRAVAYLEREQYGDRPFFDRAQWKPQKRHLYVSAGDYFWSYQINKMYNRYFLWQFAGRGPVSENGYERAGVSRFGANNTEHGVDWGQFGLPLALLLGFFGMWYHFRKDWPRGLAVLALFLATGLMVILYLNQPDPEPRERDYTFVGSFLAFSIWIGIGAAGLMELLTLRFKQASFTRQVVLPATLVLLLALLPAVMLAANYHEHDRTGNYVAWDYSYNILQSCEPDGILFTNGDNDTFPLWYLQEVEGIRKDVRVVNLSLLNTDWYIEQLRDFEPRLPLALPTERHIQQIAHPIPWKETTMSIPTPATTDPQGKIEWTMKPTLGGRFVRTQDRMIVQIMKDVNWTKPIYFAVTVAAESRIGLERYLEMEGLVYRLKTNAGQRNRINPERLRHNLLEVYRYRNLDNPKVYYNRNIRRLLQNFRTTYLQLALSHMMAGDQEGAREMLDQMESHFPEHVLPIENKQLYLQLGQLHAQAGDTANLRQRLREFPNRFNLDLNDSLIRGSLYFHVLGDFASAEEIFKQLYVQDSTNAEVVSSLVQVYQQTDRKAQAAEILAAWLEVNPDDPGARRLMEELQPE